MIHPKLLEFIPLGHAPSIKALVEEVGPDQKPLLPSLQAKLHSNPSDPATKTALGHHAEKISTAIVKEVQLRLSSEDAVATIKQCLAVVRIGNNSFSKVRCSVVDGIGVREDAIGSYNWLLLLLCLKLVVHAWVGFNNVPLE